LIIADLIYNLSLLVAVIVLSGFIDNKFDRNSNLGKYLQGLLFGFTAIIGMVYPFTLQEGLIFDGRTVVLSLCGFFFGPVAAIVAGLMAAAYRLSISGPGWIMGLITIAQAVFWGILFYNLRKKKSQQVSGKTILIMGILVHITMLLAMLGLPSNLRWSTVSTLGVTILFVYPMATMLIGKILADQENNFYSLKELSASEEKFRMYFDNAPDAVFVVNGAGDYIAANPAAVRMTGYGKEEILQKNINMMTPPEEHEFAKWHFNEVVTKGKAYGETKFIRKDGSIGWWSIDAVKLGDDRYMGFSKEITQRKAMELALEENLQRFKGLFELAPDAIMLIKLPEFLISDINNSFVELSGYAKEELIGKVSTEFHFWKSPEKRNVVIESLNHKGSIRNFETEFCGKYGKPIFCRLSASKFHFGDVSYLMIMLSDQTAQHNIELEIKKNEQRFRDLIEKLPDGFYQSTPEGKFLYVNPAFIKMLGYGSREELMGIDITNELYFDPDERDTYLISMNVQGSTIEKYRLKRKDGSTVWIEEHSRYIKDDFGNTILHEGICRDITDRILAEEEKNELIERITKVAEHLPGFIYQYCLRPDGSSYFPFASEGIKNIYGISLEEASGDVSKLFPRVLHHEDLPKVVSTITESAQTMELWQCEYRVTLPEGRIIWVEGKSKPELQADGSILWHGFITDITARKESEEKIRLSENSLRMSQQISKIGSWEYDVEKARLEWSENYYFMYGYEDTSVEPNMNLFLNKVHPEDIDFVKSKIKEFYEKPSPQKFEFRIIPHDNEVVWIENALVPVFENDKLARIRGTNQNITKRKDYEEELRKLNRAISQNPLAIVITDLRGRIEYVNPKFTEITGFTFDEAKHKNPRILKSGLMEDYFYEEMWNTLKSGNQWQGELINKKKNGEYYWANLIIAPVTDNSEHITHYIAISEDITERISMQKELITSKEKAEESDRLKSAFIANMSHEIRTPMNGIIGFSRMLTDPDLTPEEQSEFVGLINHSCNRLINTVNDILDISKIEAKQMEVKAIAFRLGELTNELSDLYTVKCQQKGLKFINNIPESLFNYEIVSDEQKVYQIINNLLSNAHKFTDSGEVELSCNLVENYFMEFHIKDTGIGIPESKIEHIFGRFNQGDYSLNRNYEGTGLGLSICVGLVDLLQGRIWVESKVGEGSTFSFSIPVFLKIDDDIKQLK